ncbi:uncharacterized protein MICPUCDRAFT_52277 [Micromonas pusilla CCMP1545]|jgi:hypothetical protein|uniref:Predicted protein n=1 Tax=Micromonas pusilla (strain CCMP1545) TaxID=564608 RepID=C1N3S1_MICPC|nr:uncharacterized protein MICPUCDRAFT_52277 [Micromonas pusilla CCMP1545]EEH53482.1 predicted protein [Micromonas pusilla CCMP1545]|eukprot:XP_003062663.1 predicted protein [Micromonas pusilla CCMP1545]
MRRREDFARPGAAPRESDVLALLGLARLGKEHRGGGDGAGTTGRTRERRAADLDDDEDASAAHHRSRLYLREMTKLATPPRKPCAARTASSRPASGTEVNRGKVSGAGGFRMRDLIMRDPDFGGERRAWESERDYGSPAAKNSRGFRAVAAIPDVGGKVDDARMTSSRGDGKKTKKKKKKEKKRRSGGDDDSTGDDDDDGVAFSKKTARELKRRRAKRAELLEMQLAYARKMEARRIASAASSPAVTAREPPPSPPPRSPPRERSVESSSPPEEAPSPRRRFERRPPASSSSVPASFDFADRAHDAIEEAAVRETALLHDIDRLLSMRIAAAPTPTAEDDGDDDDASGSEDSAGLSPDESAKLRAWARADELDSDEPRTQTQQSR